MHTSTSVPSVRETVANGAENKETTMVCKLCFKLFLFMTTYKNISYIM